MNKSKSLVYPVLTYKEFYGVKFSGTEPLVKISLFNFEDIIVALILILNDVSGNLDETIKVNETIINRLPSFKAARLRQYIHREQDDKFLLTNGTVIAKIITDLFKLLPQDGELLSAENPSFEESLLDTILIYNEWQYPDVGLGRHINTHELLWKIMLMQDLTGLNNIHYVRTANIKHIIFIQFLRGKLADKFEALEEEFRAKTGVTGLYLLAVTLINLFVGIQNKFKEPGNPIVLIEKTEEISSFLKHFGLVFNSQSAIGRQTDISFYITHPFFEHTDGRIYLVDHSHFAFAIDKGWIYFLFAHSNIKELLPGIRHFGDFQGYLGKHYYENFLILNLLKTLNKTGFRIIETNDVNLPDVTIVLNEKDIFFIEIKSASLHYKVIDDKQVSLFKKFLDDNFAGDKKGAAQLFNNIKQFGDNENNVLSIREIKQKLTIYPVIIYTEQHLEKHAVNDYVNEKFEELISFYDHPFQEIKPLVMIHYDFFVENISLLKNKPSLLKHAINAYIGHCRKKKSTFHKTNLSIDYLVAMISFDKYIIGTEKLYTLDQSFIFKNLSKTFNLKNN